jgi:murein DD-endopeptidase MepM/ murein hydrolase activator NlpD
MLMKAIPMLPKQVVYAVERYRLGAIVLYFVAVLVVITQLIGLASHVHRTNIVAPVYPAEVYPIVNKLPPPTSVTHVAAAAPIVSSVSSVSSSSSASIWPIHGKVTTEFGVFHEPWQATHTGLDISSAKPAGVTPVAAFHAGTVIQVIHSSVSYGNHVVIDHGGGLTSLYGHMADTTVSVGQQVNAGDIIGHEGSTGASTGPHVHFETDINGTPVSPRRYVTGNP